MSTDTRRTVRLHDYSLTLLSTDPNQWTTCITQTCFQRSDFTLTNSKYFNLLVATDKYSYLLSIIPSVLK